MLPVKSLSLLFGLCAQLFRDICKDQINENNRSFKLLQNGSHPNFYLVDTLDEKKFIEISQIRKMIDYTNKSSFNNEPRIILIDNIENLNKSSINALLKVAEEPGNNIYFIFIHNHSKKILNTLKSRCISFKINLFISSFNSLFSSSLLPSVELSSITIIS